MEITSSLLVAIMFIIILSMGIANLVTSLWTVVDRRSPLRMDWIYLTWTVLMLVVFLNIFWHTHYIFNVKDWEFGGFLYILCGPILMFFVSSVLTPEPERIPNGDLRGYYFSVSRQLFIFIALLQLWTVGVDFVLGRGLSRAAYFNTVMCVLALVMARFPHVKLHVAGTLLALALFVVATIMRGLGIID